MHGRPVAIVIASSHGVEVLAIDIGDVRDTRPVFSEYPRLGFAWLVHVNLHPLRVREGLQLEVPTPRPVALHAHEVRFKIFVLRAHRARGRVRTPRSQRAAGARHGSRGV